MEGKEGKGKENGIAFIKKTHNTFLKENDLPGTISYVEIKLIFSILHLGHKNNECKILQTV